MTIGGLVNAIIRSAHPLKSSASKHPAAHMSA
jgi:hypothetical protein